MIIPRAALGRGNEDAWKWHIIDRSATYAHGLCGTPLRQDESLMSLFDVSELERFCEECKRSLLRYIRP